MRYIGIDGCRAGWIVVCLDGEDYEAKVFPNMAEFWQGMGHDAEKILIDMPIGLASDSSGREVEGLARKILKGKSSSVFEVPCRQALELAAAQNFSESAYHEAIKLNREILGKAFSKQSWNIMPKIHEVDSFLQAHLQAQSIISESHPELLFQTLAGRALDYSKKSGLGFLERLEILQKHQANAREIIEKTYREYFRQLLEDDIVDALVCAIAARYTKCKSLPERSKRDAKGLPMQMVYLIVDS